MTDWRKLLVAYIDHVAETEGSDFLTLRIDSLTPDENADLLAAAVEMCSGMPSEYRERLANYALELRGGASP